MTARLEAFIARKYTTREGEIKTAWTRIGVAFAHGNGTGWNVSLEGIPAPTIKDGKATYDVVLMPPKPKEQQATDDSPPWEN